MGWIKRNLLFVVSGLVALVLLGGAGFFIFQAWSRNSDATTQLNDIYNNLQQLGSMQPQPGNGTIDNIATAKDEERQVREWMASAGARFQPVPSIPQGAVNSKTYATALGSTIYQLQQEAKAASVTLPQQYNFSFQVQSSKLTISSGLEPLAQQLGEVKAITEILLAARVNSLDGIQRVRVAEDDVANGQQSDYVEQQPITNDLAIITPYVVTFQGFTPELAKVIAGFATATNPFIVKALAVQPSNATPSAEGPAGNNPNPYMPGYGPGERPRWAPGMPGQPPTATPATGKGGLQTVLKEQLLRVTLEVDVVKLLPKS